METIQTPRPAHNPRHAVAAELFRALLTEAYEWTGQEFDGMTPTQAIETIGEGYCQMPSHLFNAITGALSVLDPDTYTS